MCSYQANVKLCYTQTSIMVSLYDLRCLINASGRLLEAKFRPYLLISIQGSISSQFWIHKISFATTNTMISYHWITYFMIMVTIKKVFIADTAGLRMDGEFIGADDDALIEGSCLMRSCTFSTSDFWSCTIPLGLSFISCTSLDGISSP